MQCRFSILAERDLEEIADYIAGDNPKRALSFVHEIRQSCEQMVHFPLAAPLRPEYGEDIRMNPVGRYLIFYTVRSEEIRIERILPAARDIETIFHSDYD